MVLLQNCVDLLSGELGFRAASSEVGNEVIRVQVEGAAEVTGGEDFEPITSLLTDAGVGFMSLDCVACVIGIQNCLSVSRYICPCKTVVLVLSTCDVNVIRRFSFVVEIMKNHDCGQIKKS